MTPKPYVQMYATKVVHISWSQFGDLVIVPGVVHHLLHVVILLIPLIGVVARAWHGGRSTMRSYQSKTEWADTDVDIDPERPRLSRNIVEEKPKGAEEDDQPAGRPMKSYRVDADPSPHRFVGHIEPTLSEQIFDGAIAERETHIEPNGVPDDRGRKLVAGKRNRHPPSYPSNRDALPLP
jgi:hypothetical protein